ncbi:nucleotidyltransferase family protein [Spirulina major]|uniref:nucleotidyltransferase family protein n=1 Tax=Spirulina major TaxID=270636 RepID=UPI00093542F4|nr:nucleotidyltransferase family protein [Spirulina major]
MRAILLAAGLGTRLRPLTATIPKCLVSIHGSPLLAIWLERLTQAGFGPFLINTHYLPSLVEQFVKDSDYKNQVTLVSEPKLRGTAGTLVSNLDFFEGQDGLLLHADNYCLADFQAFRQAHQNRPDHCLITMMTFRTPSPETCGIVGLNQAGVVTAFHEKQAHPPGNLANGAIYLLSPEFQSIVRKQFSGATDFSTEIIPYLIGQIFTYETQAPFIDIGTLDAYMMANHLPPPESGSI